MAYWNDCTEIEGLTFLGNVEVSYAEYEFDLIGVWKGEAGYYVGTDSGCSCPTPWEYIGSVDSLTGPMTREHMRLAVRDAAVRRRYDYVAEEWVDSINYPQELEEFLDGLP